MVTLVRRPFRQMAFVILVAGMMAGCGSPEQRMGTTAAGEADVVTSEETRPQSVETSSQEVPNAHRIREPGEPSALCTAVWRVGEVLPEDYFGCEHDSAPGAMDTTHEVAHGWPCADGEFLVRGSWFDDAGERFVLSARRGGVVSATRENEFDNLVVDCLDR